MKSINFSTLFSFRFEEGREILNFSTPTHELIYFQTGRGICEIGGEEHKYEANDLLFITAKTQRNQVALEESRYICIRFQGEISSLSNTSSSLPAWSSLKSACYTCKDDRIFQQFKDIQEEYQQKNMGYYEMCNLKIGEILLLLERISPEDENTHTILSVVKEIDETVTFAKSVEEMAKSVHYSYDYFRHKFKAVTGKSPIQYLTDSKMEHACDLLTENRLNCTEIAYLLGFSSSSQFSKMFKKKIGLSPSHYKKQK